MCLSMPGEEIAQTLWENAKIWKGGSNGKSRNWEKQKSGVQ